MRTSPRRKDRTINDPREMEALLDRMPVRTIIFHVFFNSNQRNFFTTNRNAYRPRSSSSRLAKVRGKKLRKRLAFLHMLKDGLF